MPSLIVMQRRPTFSASGIGGRSVPLSPSAALPIQCARTWFLKFTAAACRTSSGAASAATSCTHRAIACQRCRGIVGSQKPDFAFGCNCRRIPTHLQHRQAIGRPLRGALQECLCLLQLLLRQVVSFSHQKSVASWCAQHTLEQETYQVTQSIRGCPYDAPGSVLHQARRSQQATPKAGMKAIHRRAHRTL